MAEKAIAPPVTHVPAKGTQESDACLTWHSSHREKSMLRFRKDTWAGNHWPSIEIEPVDTTLFPRLLLHLSRTHIFAMPVIVDTIDGYAANFVIHGSHAKMMVDTWSFSIAFEQEHIRDLVFTELATMSI
jgi:hypothetical protein